MSGTDIVFIRMNNLQLDPRLIKQVNCVKPYWDYYTITWNFKKAEKTNSRNLALNLNINYGSFWIKPAYFVWALFCLYNLTRIKPRVIHACDLEANLIARCYKFFSPRAKIVYDLFDATADKYDFGPKSAKRLMLLNFEKKIIKKADILLIPDEKRLEQFNFSFEEKKRLNFEIIYNSNNFVLKSEKEKVILSQKPLELVYIGVIIRKIRGLEFLIRVAEELKEVHITIGGFGNDEEYFSSLIQQKNLPNLTFLGKINYELTNSINKKGDLIVSLLDPGYNNYRYATSTKLFDAFGLMKPVITTTNTATGDLATQTNWGFVIPYNYLSLKKLLIDILSEKVAVNLNSAKIQKYRWQNCNERVILMYKKLLI